MCTDVSVCKNRIGYQPPEPETRPLFRYLQAKARAKDGDRLTPYEAIAEVESLLEEKQCYMYAIETNPRLYNYDATTKSFDVPTDFDYEYSEKDLLKSIN